MADLITRQRALRNLGELSPSAGEALVIDTLISAVSRAIEKYCGCSFSLQQFDELYNGDGQRRLLLKNYPVQAVERVAYCPTVVLRVLNTSSANQRARVQVTDNGLSLVHIASGVTSVNTLNFADETTLGDLADAVNALGNGWSAAVTSSDFEELPSEDLKAIQGSFNALNVQAGLRLHTQELAAFEVNAANGWLVRSSAALTTGELLAACGPGWHGGINYWRVIYTAGYDDVPEDVQEACAQWVAAWFWQTKRDPGLSQEHLPGVVLRSPERGMPKNVHQLLSGYRRRKVLHMEG